MPTPGDLSMRDMPFELFEKVCRELKEAGTREITLIGEGEPFFHPRLVDIVATAKAAGFDLGLFTNGTMLNEDVVRGLISAGLDTLRVSLWAINPEDYGKNHPGTPAKYFGRVVEGLKLVRKLKEAANGRLPRVILCHPINRNNVESLGDMPGFARSVGVDAVYLGAYRARSKMYEPFLLDDAETAKLDETLRALKERFKALSIEHNLDNMIFRNDVGVSTWDKAPCYIGWYHARVRVDGTIVPCDNCQVCVGDMKRESFLEIWSGPAYRAFRESVSTKAGLARAGRVECNCDNCCYVQENYRIYRVMRRLEPLLALFGRR
jgi:MoaA/NifB/PqqE/SkfB family radical SAM enzyme